MKTEHTQKWTLWQHVDGNKNVKQIGQKTANGRLGELVACNVPVKHAHLIVAAPELLAACQYVVKWHREHDSGEGELYGLDFVTTCIGAISKAKGTTP